MSPSETKNKLVQDFLAKNRMRSALRTSISLHLNTRWTLQNIFVLVALVKLTNRRFIGQFQQ